MSGFLCFSSFFLLLSLVALSSLDPLLCSEGCVSCSRSSGMCTACRNGFDLDIMGRCLQPKGSEHCSLFGFSLSDCKQCRSTFRLDQGKCLKDFSGCLEFQSERCVRCGWGTRLVKGKCQGVLHCRKEEGGVCKQCERGHLLRDNRCYYVGKDCGRIDEASGACAVCRSELVLSGFSCQRKEEVVINCDVFKDGECQECKKGYGVWKGKCVPIPHCEQGWFLNNRFECSPLPFGCSTMLPTGLFCSRCFPNFQLLNDTCQPTLPPHCLELNARGKCLHCAHRYYPSNYSCSLVSHFCLTYNARGGCLSCRWAYFNKVGGNCSDPYCLEGTAQGCSRCRELFDVSPQGDRCLIKDPRCLNASEVSCQECVGGFYPSSDVCLPLPLNCLKANRKGHCLFCKDNYFLQLDRCHPVQPTLNHCRLYSPYSYIPHCIECYPGYFLSLAKCLEVPPNCQVLLSSGKCALCAPGFDLTEGGCFRTGLLEGEIVGCQTRKGGRCVRCRGGQVLGRNGACYPSVEGGCEEVGPRGNCLKCKQGSLVSGKTCLKVNLVDINCKEYRGSDCISCYPGYYLGAGRCKLPSRDCRAFSLQDGGCLSCYGGYTLTNRQCVLLPEKANCLAYDNRGNCIRCAAFYFAEKGACSAVSPLCRLYHVWTGACTGCYSGFDLRNGTCVRLSVVSYLDPQTGQLVTRQACEKYQGGECVRCVQGYELHEASCLNINSFQGVDPFCSTFLNRNFCLLCYQGYHATQGVCRPKDPLCSHYNGSTCLACYSGYSLQLGQCLPAGSQRMDPCLRRRTGSDKCQECRMGHYLTSARECEVDPFIEKNSVPFCLVANQSLCSLCQNGFYAKEGVCFQVPASCLSYDPDSGRCFSCKESYLLVGERCIWPAMGEDPLCRSYEGVFCRQCEEGYYLKDYVCNRIDPLCLEFNHAVSQCVRCSRGKPLFDACREVF